MAGSANPPYVGALHSRLLATFAACSLLLAAPAALAGGTSYKGKTDQNRTVTFKVSGGKVRSFVGGVNMFCVGDGIEFNAAIPPKAMKVKGGKFSYKGRDKIDSVNLEISGKVSAAKVTGKLSMTDSRYDAANQEFHPCSGKATFSAKAK